MVHSVAAVPNVGKIKREHQNPVYSGTMAESSNGSFAQVLERAKEETQSSPMNCVTTTYGSDCRMRTFFTSPGNTTSDANVQVRDLHYILSNTKTGFERFLPKPAFLLPTSASQPPGSFLPRAIPLYRSNGRCPSCIV